MKILGINIPGSKPETSTSEQRIIAILDEIKRDPQNKAAKDILAKAARRDPVKVFSTLVNYQRLLYRKEIATWKSARSAALNIFNPNRQWLIDLYEDMELDALISGIVSNKRIFKISNKPFKIVDKAGKENEEKTKWLSHQWFNDLLKFAMQSRFFGYSLVYFYEWNAEGEIIKTELMPRRHVKPDWHMWCKYQSDITGFDFTEAPWNQYMIGIGDEHDLGLYDKAATLYILKKHSWQNWDEFEERFGIPIPIVETASTDAKVLDLIESWLRDLSTGSYGVVPDNGKLNIVETGKTDSFNVFFRKIQAANMELEILFTGQWKETQEHGTYGTEMSKLQEANELIEDDKLFIKNIINDKLLPLLIANGYKFEEGDKFDWNDGKKLSPKERLEILSGVQKLGFKLDMNQVSNDLDVIIEEGEPIEEPIGKDDEPIKKITNMHKLINALYNHV